MALSDSIIMLTRGNCGSTVLKLGMTQIPMENHNDKAGTIVQSFSSLPSVPSPYFPTDLLPSYNGSLMRATRVRIQSL